MWPANLAAWARIDAGMCGRHPLQKCLPHCVASERVVAWFGGVLTHPPAPLAKVAKREKVACAMVVLLVDRRVKWRAGVLVCHP